MIRRGSFASNLATNNHYILFNGVLTAYNILWHAVTRMNLILVCVYVHVCMIVHVHVYCIIIILLL